MSALRTLWPAALLAALLATASGCGGCGSTAPGDGLPPEPRRDGPDLRVAAAADLRYALEDVRTAFLEKYPGLTVEVTYGSSGQLYHQLRNGADFDLFLSADVDYPQRLVEDGVADRDSPFVYAVGHLVVWVPKDSKLDVGGQGLRVVLDPSVKKVAMANPRHAPYGRAAEAALKSAGVYDQVADRLVLGDNITQTAQFVETGGADVGLLAQSLAQAPPLRDKGRFALVPPETYPLLRQGGVVLSRARDRGPARQFRDFLLGPEGKALLKRYGFDVQGE
jgi:molybdate transport system substrate-binding protein